MFLKANACSHGLCAGHSTGGPSGVIRRFKQPSTPSGETARISDSQSALGALGPFTTVSMLTYSVRFLQSFTAPLARLAWIGRLSAMYSSIGGQIAMPMAATRSPQ